MPNKPAGAKEGNPKLILKVYDVKNDDDYSYPGSSVSAVVTTSAAAVANAANVVVPTAPSSSSPIIYSSNGNDEYVVVLLANVLSPALNIPPPHELLLNLLFVCPPTFV